MFAQNLRCLVAQREQPLDKLSKELLALSLVVGRNDWLARPHHFRQLNQFGNSWRDMCRKNVPW